VERVSAGASGCGSCIMLKEWEPPLLLIHGSHRSWPLLFLVLVVPVMIYPCLKGWLVAGLPLICISGGDPGYKAMGRSHIHDSIIINNSIYSNLMFLCSACKSWQHFFSLGLLKYACYCIPRQSDTRTE
jgi:hypothetical protein